MLSAYRPLFSVPGAGQFIVGSILARLGGAMFGISIIVMVSTRTGSYAIAGVVSAVGVVVLAVAGPLLGGLVDRRGQGIALPFTIGAAAFGLTAASVSFLGMPWWLVALAYGVSAFVPAASTLSRARWVSIYEGDADRLHTAMSFEQIMEEISFVVGPVLAVLVSTQWFPEAGLVLAEVLLVVGTALVVLERLTMPALVPHDERPGGLAIHRRGMLVVATVLVMVGVIFGSNEVLAVAIADAAGDKPFSSVLLGAFALGSAISGVVFGSLVFRTSLTRRFLYAACGMFLLEAPALVSANLWWLTAVLLVAGSATAPMLITSFTLAQNLVPRALITEGMAVAVTGILVGISIGTTTAGWAVETFGAHPAYGVPVAAGAVAVLVAGLAYRRIVSAEVAETV